MHNPDGGSFKCKIQQHFRLLKTYGQIPVAELLGIATGCEAFSQADFDAINLSHRTLKMSMFWKRLLKKGENHCKTMIEKLHERDAKTIESILNKRDASEKHQHITEMLLIRDTLVKLQFHICNEMDLSRGVHDMLFENGTINLEDHDKIDSMNERMAKRQELMAILFSKNDSDWIPDFIHILRETDHDNLINDLNRFQNDLTGARPDSNQQHVPTRTIAIHMESQSYNTEHFRGIQQDRGAIEDAIHQMLDGEVLDIREGSVVILVRTTNLNQIISVLDGSNKITSLDFLKSLFSSSKHIGHYFGNEFTVKLWAEEIPFTNKDEPLNTGYCAGCFYQTVINNYKPIFDEIENDIMDETMATLKEGTCDDEILERIMHIKSRTKKAADFLQLILDNDVALLRFKTVFENLSQLEIKESKCRKCIVRQGATEKICEYKVKGYTDIKGNVKVTFEPLNTEYESEAEINVKKLQDFSKTSLRPSSEKGRNSIIENVTSHLRPFSSPS